MDSNIDMSIMKDIHLNINIPLDINMNREIKYA